MFLVASLLASAALAEPRIPPAPVTDFLAAVHSSDLPAARAILAEDVTIMDNRAAAPVASSLEAFASYARDCERTDLTWDVEPEIDRAAAVVSWTCASGDRRQDMIWTHGPRIVWIQFGLPQLQ